MWPAAPGCKQPVSILPCKILHLPSELQKVCTSNHTDVQRENEITCVTDIQKPIYIEADSSCATGVHRSESVNPHLRCIPPLRSDTNILE